MTTTRGMSPARAAAALAVITAGAELVLIRLGRTYGATSAERRSILPGDEILDEPQVQTDHATTIDAPPAVVWPWLKQMGWGRAGWYTARWVDRLLFPANAPSLDVVVAELQDIGVGTFIPDGAPETGCGFTVVRLEEERALVLRSTSHLPQTWRSRAQLDWTWTFVLTPVDGGRRTRFHFRSRWITHPWWLSAAGLLAVVPADFVMGRGMLLGVTRRVEGTAAPLPTSRLSTSTAAIATRATVRDVTRRTVWTWVATGAVCTVLRYRLRTLWAPVLAHGFDDKIGFLWFFAFGPVYGLW